MLHFCKNILICLRQACEWLLDRAPKLFVKKDLHRALAVKLLGANLIKDQ